jgi:hypothetical protein
VGSSTATPFDPVVVDALIQARGQPFKLVA